MKVELYKVSIIIAAYNAEKYIDECLLSILNSSYRNIEVIIVDDGSIDSTSAIVERYRLNDGRVFIYRKENGGASSARNLALKYCTGDLIAIVDADDFIEEDSIEKLVNVFIEKDCDIALYEVFLFGGDNKIRKFKKNLAICDLSNIEALRLSLDWDITTLGIYKKELFECVKFDESNIHGDELTSRVLFFKSKKITLTDAKYFYRINNDSVSRKFSLQKFGILENQTLIKKFLEEHSIFNECKSAYVKQAIKVTFGCAYLLVSNFDNIDKINSDRLKLSINSQIDNIVDLTKVSFNELSYKEKIIYLFMHHKLIFWLSLNLYHFARKWLIRQ